MKHLLVFIAIFFAFITTAQAMDVALTCDPNTETDLAGYKIYYSSTSGGPYTAYSALFPYGSGVAPEFRLTVPDGLKYFVATAYDTQGNESEYSNEVSTDGSPKAPGGLKIKGIVLVITPEN